jgi:hypothetical protein
MNDGLRIGDAEREAAARELGEHFAMGRITAEEHGERLERVWTARTAADLGPVFADLPRPRPPEPEVPWSSRLRSRIPPLPRMPLLFKLLVAVVVVALIVTHLPLLLIALLVYVFAVRRVAHRNRSCARWR